MRPPDVPPGGEDGFALLVVLAFLLLAAAIAIPFFETGRHYAFVARNVANETRGDLVLESALLIAAQRYLELAARPNVRIPTRILCRTEGRFQTMTFRFQDHAGLIDLNVASGELLQLGFGALGADTTTAERLADAAERYRRPLAPGAREETDDMVPGGLKHAPFEQPEELLDFVGLRDVGRQAIGEVFTVRSGLGTLNRRFLSPRLRAHLASLPRRTEALEEIAGQPLTALTLDGVFVGPAGEGIGAAAVFRPDAAGTIARRDGPVDRTVATAPPAADDPATCRRFFDDGSLALLAEVAR